MDRDVRWFRREIALKIAQRLAVEVIVVCSLAAVVLVAAEVDVVLVVLATALVAPTFVVTRLVLSCLMNPSSSSYLVRWPHPSGALTPTEPTNVGSATDVALQASGFSPIGAFSEWGGAVTHVYDSPRRLAMTGSDDDVIILTGLSDGRLCVTTTNVIPPHERLIVGHVRGYDIADMLTTHDELLGEVTEGGVVREIDSTPQLAIELLVTEWEIWEQIGPFVGPFVAVGHRRQPSLLRARVSAAHIRSRGLTTGIPTMPIAIAHQPRPVEPASVDHVDAVSEPQPKQDDVAHEVFTTLIPLEIAETPPSRLSFLAEQARLAGERTERAIAAGESPVSHDTPLGRTPDSTMSRAS